ncbi:amylo-alpha-1,6-glucosidase [Yunchengibacter salinarum]|uniref:amylo-alpha-1,6-glucosidase n=1 Tax=Yunchengibacter salinarum TaxID=3133399 RepID=UPI0035B666D1
MTLSHARISPDGPRIDIRDVPFSTYGSWLSVSPIRKRSEPFNFDHLYLRLHRHETLSVLRLTPTRNGAAVAGLPTMCPAMLCWTDTGGGTNGGTSGGDDAGASDFLAASFETPERLRLAGQGVGLTLHPETRAEIFTTDATPPARHCTINMLHALHRLNVTVHRGRMHWSARRDLLTATEHDVRLTLEPDADGVLDLSFDLYTSTPPEQPADPPAFDQVVAARRDAFARWLSREPEVPDGLGDARALSAYIRWSAVVAPHGLVSRPAMMMSMNWMVKLWSWDHCFNAIATARNDARLAWDQMLMFADRQDEHGCYPDAFNDTHMVFNYTKPPIHGWAVMKMVEAMGGMSAVPRARLLEMARSLERWTDWWLTHRRREGEDLPFYQHGFDSGWDNATVFDRSLPTITPDLAAYLVVQMDVLADLFTHLGQGTRGRFWRWQADAMMTAMTDRLMTGDGFIARTLHGDQAVDTEGLIHAMPILLGERLSPAMKTALVARIDGLTTPWGLATEHPDSPLYEPDGYWRGPIWAPATYLVIDGLMRAGETARALEIARRFCAMGRIHGFAECHDALTGEKLRDRGFTWTASSFLLMGQMLEKAGIAMPPDGETRAGADIETKGGGQS